MRSKLLSFLNEVTIFRKVAIAICVIPLVIFWVAPLCLAETNVSTAKNIDENNETKWVPCGSGPGTPNPAAIYCIEMGYELSVVQEKDGGQHSVCTFPNGDECDAWSFMIGTCGEEYSYCAVNGFDQIIKSDGKHPFSPTYPVCVDRPAVSLKSDLESTETVSKEVGNPLDLMGITDRLINRKIERAPLPIKSDTIKSTTVVPLAVLPESFDWRNHDGGNWTTPPKDQNACGSCWAHSAVSATEAAYSLFVDDPDYNLDLSEEYPNSDCLLNNSCCGGWHDVALDLIKTNGVPDEACLPYDSVFYSTGNCNCFGQAGGCPDGCPQNDTGICNEKDCGESCGDVAARLIGISDYTHVGTDTDSIKQALIDHGPLSVCFGTSGGTYWDQVDGGPSFRRCNSDNPGYVHCVTIVGYDNDNGGFWIVKDNYGTTSGDGTGHWRMGYGECNIQELAYYVTPSSTENLPPVAHANGPYSAECKGEFTSVTLDGSASYDPNDDAIDFLWSTDCPNATFDDDKSATPVLTVDTSEIGCSLSCNVTLSVSNDSWPVSTSSTTVDIQDTQKPTLNGIPGDVTVECDSVPEKPTITADDVCDSSPVVNSSETYVSGSSPDNYTLERYWTATDACGNSITEKQTITVEDTTEPTISFNAKDTISPPEAPISFTVTAEDNCDPVPSVSITAYDCGAFTKKGKRIDKTESCVVSIENDTITILDTGGVNTTIKWTAVATDRSGNYTEEEFGMLVVNPAK
jgi:putative hemolysin/C1A family cysteine protease